MPDSTAHNIGVMQKVCEKLEVDVKDCTYKLLCNINPLRLFQNKIKKFYIYNDVQQSFGVYFKNKNFILKSNTCLVNILCREYSA